jgi:hypothetical protein
LRLTLREGAVEQPAFWGGAGHRFAELRELGTVDVVYTIDVFPPRPGNDPEQTLRVLDMRPTVG